MVLVAAVVAIPGLRVQVLAGQALVDQVPVDQVPVGPRQPGRLFSRPQLEAVGLSQDPLGNRNPANLRHTKNSCGIRRILNRPLQRR